MIPPFRTKARDMTERLNVNYYLPEFVTNAAALEARGTVALHTLYGKMGIGHTASVEPHYATNGVGVPLISGKAIKGCELVESVAERIKPESHQSVMAKSRLKPGFLLVIRKGEIGNACVVPKNATEMNCSSEVMFFAGMQPADAYYLAAFFNSRRGRLIVEREQRGSIIPGVSLLDVPDIRVVDPGDNAKAYIGDKLQQAERLRERARALECEIQQLSTTEEIEAALRLPESRTNRLNASELGYRLDSKHYGLRATAVFKACGKNCVTIQEFGPDVSNGFEYREFCDSGISYVTVGDVSSGRLNLDSAPRIPSSVDIPEKARLDVMCVLVVRSGSIGAAVKVVAEDTDACISSHLIRLRFKDEESAAVVACFLNSPAGKAIQQKIVYGGVQPQISQHELLEIPVPRDVVQCGTQLLSLLNRREQAIRVARRLTATAKLLVEALIEGKVTEAELKDAHTNRDIDRALLQRLTRRGIDVPNDPLLFPNLDDLYAALDESADAAVTVEAH